MTSGCERKDLDPNITLELTPDEITLVDAVQLDSFESGSFILVHGEPPSPPVAPSAPVVRKTESEDQNVDANATVDPTLDDDAQSESPPAPTLRTADIRTK